MKVYKKYFVAIKPKCEEDEERLSYLLPLDGTKKDEDRKSRGISWSKERQKIGDEWVCKDGEHFELDNVETSGYKIIGFSNRYSTSNKHIYVLHPNGFYFELAIETFVELIKECVVENGEIKDDLIIYSYKGKNALCSTKSELYSKLEFIGEKPLDIKVVNIGQEVVVRGISSLSNKVYYAGLHTLKVDAEIQYSESDLVSYIDAKPSGVQDRWGFKSTDFIRDYKLRTRSHGMEYSDKVEFNKTSNKKQHLFLVCSDNGYSVVSKPEKSKLNVISIGDSDYANILETVCEVLVKKQQWELQYYIVKSVYEYGKQWVKDKLYKTDKDEVKINYFPYDVKAVKVELV